MVVQSYSLSINTAASNHILIVQASQLGRSICILLVISRIQIVLARRHALTRKRRQIALILLSPQLLHNILVVLSVQICDLRQSHLVATILVFEVIKVVFASPYDVDSIIWVSSH